MNKNIKHIVDYYVKKCGSRNPFDIAVYLNIRLTNLDTLLCIENSIAILSVIKHYCLIHK